MMIARRWRGGEGRSFREVWRRDQSGGAASEFSVILPIALVLFTGAVTYGNAIYIDRKVTLTTRTITDLVTQYTSISKSDLQTLLGASSSIMAPYSSANLGVRVSEVSTDASGKATIIWTTPLNANGPVRNQGDVVTLPTSISTPNATYIWGEVQYAYTPSIGYQVTGSIILHDQTYMSPRLSTTIAETP
jgi:Flp pilus assembly protein TadG